MEKFKYKFDDLFEPLLQALKDLGGSGSVSEIEDQVAKNLNLSEEEINDISSGGSTKLSYRLGWARTYLKNYGLLENSARGVWALSEKGENVTSIDKEKIKRKTRSTYYKEHKKSAEVESEIDMRESEFDWQEEVLKVIQKISAKAFEKLCQRVLREFGFINVEVTGRSGDGGIDGKGVIQLGGVLSFHVVFQAKRYKGTIPANQIRDFRGAMVGRADKGLFITTGSFTRDARQESQRVGAPPIDLIDGQSLAARLKELKLGIETEIEEKVIIKKEWFDSL